jgi:hypothetical protein
MKQFLNKLIYFTLVIILVIILNEIAFHKFRLTNFDIALSKSINNFEEVSKDIDVLFLGDSRTYYGINPVTINSKFIIHNYSFASEPIQTTYWKMRYYFDNEMLDNLKSVYILFDESMVSSDSRIGLQTSYDYSKFYNYYFNEITETMPLNKKLGFWFSINSSTIRLKSSFKTIIRNKLFSIMRKNGKQEIIEKSGFANRAYNIEHKNFEREKSYMINGLKETRTMNIVPVKYYHKLVDLLAEKDIRVFFYKMPSTSIILLKENKSVEKYFRIKQEREEEFIKSEFPNSAYINFSKIDIEWCLEDFSDRGHLNSKGAYKLGEYLRVGI